MKTLKSRQIWTILIAMTFFVMILILLLIFLLPIMRDSQSVSESIYNLFESFFPLLSLVILPILLYIIFIKILILLKKKSILIGGVIGSIIGFFHVFILYNLPKSFQDIAVRIMKPLHSLLNWVGVEGIGLAIMYVIISVFLYGIVGALIGYIASKIKVRG